MPAADLIKRALCFPAQLLFACGRFATLLTLFASASLSAQNCPELQSFYPSGNPAPQQDWAKVLLRLEAELENCLQNAEYFALLGAAQLNTGQLSQALESLERALLIDPDNGAARIDYAEGLYLAGQVFPALEINGSLLLRQDLPATLKPVLEARQQSWRQQTRNRRLLLEATAGYDNNLNGAPTRSDLSLTFGGSPVSFTLDADSQPQQGSFTNLRMGGAWQWATPSSQHELVATARARQASAGDADLAQADWRYTYAVPTRQNRWEWSAGSSHMLFGGSPLYSVGDLRARVVLGNAGCRPSAEAGLQKLNFHGQSVMNGIETSLFAGYACQFSTESQLRLEGGLINNNAAYANRPGGDRSGWNLRLNWQLSLLGGELASQLGYAHLDDDQGYSALLNNGALRQVGSYYANIRYQRLLTGGLSVLFKVSHQRQHSNLQPFENRGTAAEAGLALNF